MTLPVQGGGEPPRDCPLCPRLVEFRTEQQVRHPDWRNAPVPTFGADARLLIVGLAPGLQGANRTGRPFTGDWAGDLLYETLGAVGLSRGQYDERPDDGLELIGTAVTNAVRCVPPENKPTGPEIATCRRFLTATIASQSKLVALVALGRIAHDSVVRAFGGKLSATPFGHGREHQLPHPEGRPVRLFDSYHCSRYNTNTGVLTPDMFRAVFRRVRDHLDQASPAAPA